MITINIEGFEVPSQNVTMRQHWAKTAKMNTRLLMTIKCMIKESHKVSADHPIKRRVKIIAYRKRFISDHSNLVGGCKGLIDAIKRAGLLVDDSDQWMRAEYWQSKASESPTGKPYTIITITNEE